MNWIIYIFSILGCIICHEAAHALVARFHGIKIIKVALGFGKTLYSKKIKNIIYEINLFPLGGFCELDGDNCKIKQGWLNLPYFKKVTIVLAGISVNLLIAFICYLINYGSIITGVLIDFKVLISILTKNYQLMADTIYIFNPNFLLIQISVVNAFAAIVNLFPFPCLDGSFPFLFLLEKINKEKYISLLNSITKIGFYIIMIVQILFIIWFLWI